jgi:hypothetical protein
MLRAPSKMRFDFPLPCHYIQSDVRLFIILRIARLYGCPVFSVFSKGWAKRSAKTGKRVQIPRCRATVSEDMSLGHWETPGKAADESG